MMISNHHRGSLYACLSGFLYGFVAYFGIKVIHSSLSVSNMLFWRFFISSLVIGVIVIRKARREPIALKPSLIAFSNGAIFYGLSTMLYFFACPYIGSGLAMVIFFSYPALVIMLNYFFHGQKIPRIYYYAIITIFLGMLLFVDTKEMKFDLFGIFLALISALFYAGYIVSSKKIASLPPTTATFFVCLGCMVTSLFFSLLNQTFSIPSDPHTWLNILGIGIVSTAIPILLLLYSMNYISPEKASILSVLEPVFVLIFGVTLLGEEMKLQYAFGVIIVLTGALFTLFSQQTHATTEQLK